MAKDTKKENKTELKSQIIKSSRVTEKSSNLSAQNAYTFNISPRANKTEIAKEVQKIYKVKPLKVRIVNFPKKKIHMRGNPGSRGGGKKAIVYLKKGDKIELA
jgi:large subunit ribosomal protein L23